MPNRFPLTPVTLVNDPFCTDGFCQAPVVTAQVIGGSCQGLAVDVSNWNNYYIGTTVTATNISCDGAIVRWYNSAGGFLKTGPSFTFSCNAPGGAYYVVTCPDGSVYTDPIKQVNFPEFWFDSAPIVNATYSFQWERYTAITVFCTGIFGPPVPLTPTSSSDLVQVGLLNTRRLRMATPQTQPNTTNETGVLLPPIVSIQISCCNGGNWISANLLTRQTRTDGSSVNTYHGGGNFMSYYDHSETSYNCPLPLSIILTENAPGLGSTGDDVFWCGLKNYDEQGFGFYYRAQNYVYDLEC